MRPGIRVVHVHVRDLELVAHIQIEGKFELVFPLFHALEHEFFAFRALYFTPGARIEQRTLIRGLPRDQPFARIFLKHSRFPTGKQRSVRVDGIVERERTFEAGRRVPAQKGPALFFGRPVFRLFTLVHFYLFEHCFGVRVEIRHLTGIRRTAARGEYGQPQNENRQEREPFHLFHKIFPPKKNFCHTVYFAKSI